MNEAAQGKAAMTPVPGFYKDKRILVTGAAGTVGTALIAALMRGPIAKLYALDNDETETYYLETTYKGDPRFVATCGDVRDQDKLHHVMSDVDIVFHGAALKHVTICERAPFDAVQTNILGVQNIINAALGNSVERVIFMSSDKAVNPTNVMGTSKLMGERLITAANSLRADRGTIFSSTRFGNVMGSRGSVVELFQKQIAAGGPVTLTDKKMSRFVMTPAQAVTLILRSAELARGGEVFVTKMPTLLIKDLLEVMVAVLADRYGYAAGEIGVQELGSRPGEKLYEELLNEEETRRTLELEDHYVILPAFRYIYDQISYDYPGVVRSSVEKIYRSDLETAMARGDVRNFLLDHDLIAAAPANV